MLVRVVLTNVMDCRVVVEAAVPVYDVETADEAVRIAISKTGEMLNPDLNYVEIETGHRSTPSGEELPPAFVAADEALVALELQMDVFNVDRGEHASRVARKEIGQRLRNIPLTVLDVQEIERTDDDTTDADTDDEGTEDPTDSVDNDVADADAVDDAPDDDPTDSLPDETR